MHKFEQDFYGSELRLAIVGYIRPYMSFSSLEELKQTMHNDVRIGSEALDDAEYRAYQNDSFFFENGSNSGTD